MTKPFEKMSDSECKQVESLAYNAQCAAHGQALTDCANQRLAQVKAARVMDERSTKSALAWQKEANGYLEELKKLRTPT